ncbi:MAG: YjgP/YjgQ family permease, partial [Lentisphaerae bacterium]
MKQATETIPTLICSEPSPVRKVSPHLAWYCLRSFVFYLFLLMFLFLILITAFQVMNDISDFSGKNIPVQEIILYFLYQFPDKMPYLFPVSILFATFKMIADMVEHNEIIAMRAAGLSSLQIFLPLLIFTLLCSLLLVMNNEIIAPFASQTAQTIHYSAMHGHTPENETSAHRLLAFRNYRQHRDWLMRSIDQQGECKEVFIQQFNAKKQLIWELWADQGHYDTHKKHWIFSNVTQRRYQPDPLWPTTSTHQRLELPDLKETPLELTFFTLPNGGNHMPLHDIIRILRSKDVHLPVKTKNILSTIVWHRLTSPLSCVIAVLIAIPLASCTRRTGMIAQFFLATFLF